MAFTEKDITAALSRVMEPELHRDLVTLNMVKDIKISGGDVSFAIELTTPACPLKDVMEKDARAELAKIPGMGKVSIEWTSNVLANAKVRSTLQVPVKNIIAVASGKGGVGKSTVSVNLAIALSKLGARVGLLDNDVYGPNVPIMLGLPTAQLSRDGKESIYSVETKDGKLIPMEKYGIKVMSIAFAYPIEQPLVWRGPMLHAAIRQFLQDVTWGELDYLIIDMPPGTGDAQLSLGQVVQGAMGIIVTTPQLVSMSDALRGLNAFEQMNIPIIGVVENMGPYTDPSTGAKVAMFGEGGGQRLATMKNAPFLGSVPLDPMIRVGGDSGKPVIVASPDSETSKRIMDIAQQVAARVSVINYKGEGVVPITITN